MADPITIGFIGTGKMATALAQGFMRANLVTKQTVWGSDLDPEALSLFAQATGARTTADNQEVVQNARHILLAVKPRHVRDVLMETAKWITQQHLVISVAAGIRLHTLAGLLPEGVPVVRVMPNTPALVGASATAYTLSEQVTADDGALVNRLFSAVGLAFQVSEPLLDAVTGLSGSGPAYACLVIEALSDGGVAVGLPRQIATQLAAQTLLGTAKMVLETGLHPGILKDQVASPGGTTIAGLHELEKGGLRGALFSAVKAAADKAKQLGQ